MLVSFQPISVHVTECSVLGKGLVVVEGWGFLYLKSPQPNLPGGYVYLAPRVPT